MEVKIREPKSALTEQRFETVENHELLLEEAKGHTLSI